LLSLDGAHGEGGGQILRTAVALSVLNKVPIEIRNIRANRPDSGIKAQHYIAIKSVKELCNAETSGLEVGSSNLTFNPGELKGGKYKFDIGTAGSIILVFQTCILSCLRSKEDITIQIKGGTENKWAPTWDYFEHVFIPLIKKIGVSVDTQLIKRGYYPKGGGEALITIHSTANIKPLIMDEEQKFSDVEGIINISNLPEHISTRIKHTTINELLKSNLKSNIIVEQTNSLSQGVGITLWTKSKDAVLGSAVIGERGLSSEEVGKKAAKDLLSEINSCANLDIHALDQLLPYMVLSNESSSCLVREISSHAMTNMWILKQFLDVDFEVKHNKSNYLVTVKK